MYNLLPAHFGVMDIHSSTIKNPNIIKRVDIITYLKLRKNVSFMLCMSMI